MTTFKACIRLNQSNKQGLTNIKIRITHNGNSDYFSTEHYIKPDFMNNKKGIVKDKCPNADYYNSSISDKINDLIKKKLKAGNQVDRWSVKQLKEYLSEEEKENIDFFEYTEKRIQFLKENNKATWKVYSDALHVFKQFVGVRILPFSSLDKRLLERFESYSLNNGRSLNTISVYLRSIRALFNDAIDDLNIDGREPVITNYPFRTFRIKNEKTRKRNLSVEAIRKIRDYIPKDKYQEFARDMFMLIFYLIGINTKDLYYLDEITKGRIDFSRFKTGSHYSIKVEPEALKIIEKYKGEKYLINAAEHFKHHKSFQRQINDKLTGICKEIKIEKITTYHARHSFGTISRNDLNISKDNIALCLGHKDPRMRVTDIYLNEDLNIIDRCNRMMIDYVNKS